MKQLSKNWQTILMIIGIAWIILPDPIIGPLDDGLVAFLEILPILTQAINKIRSARYARYSNENRRP